MAKLQLEISLEERACLVLALQDRVAVLQSRVDRCIPENYEDECEVLRWSKRLVIALDLLRKVE